MPNIDDLKQLGREKPNLSGRGSVVFPETEKGRGEGSLSGPLLLPTPEVMNVEELADYLSLGTRTVYRLAHKGEIPGTKIAGAWRFPKASIDDWLKTEAAKNLAGGEG